MNMTDKSLDDRAIERRGEDRRRFSMETLLASLFRYRRRDGRRDGDNINSYTDWYGPWPLVATLSIILLCFVDAFLTLILLNHGAEELNVMMDILIRKDYHLFTIIKMSVTGLALIVLVMHFNFRIYKILSVRYLMYALVPMYMLLVAHELNMLSQI
ncbi:MAG: DUF5658 family protein [Pseudomonadota bacterium]